MICKKVTDCMEAEASALVLAMVTVFVLAVLSF